MPGLRCISAPSEARDGDLVIAADTERPGDLVARLIADTRGWRFILTGHVAPGSAAAGLVAAGRARRLPWNVHPRARDQLWLAETTGARHLLPAFGALDAAPGLTRSLAARICAAPRSGRSTGRAIRPRIWRRPCWRWKDW